MRRKTRKQQPKLSSDSLLKTSKKGHVELTEKELDKVFGGSIYMKYGDIKGQVTTDGFTKSDHELSDGW